MDERHYQRLCDAAGLIVASAAEEIAKLDRSLAKRGEDVILQRTTGTTNQATSSVKCRAFVRNYTAQELIAGIIQGESHVIISSTQIIAARWPGGVVATTPPATSDPRVPRTNDKVVVAGKVRNVQSATPIYIDGELVRIDVEVLG